MPEPRSVDVRADVVVDAPPAATWAAVTDWERQGRWIPATTVRVTGGDGRSVGTTLEAFTGLGRLGFVDPMVVTRWEPPWRCEVRHTGSVVRGSGVFEVVALPDGRSRFVWSEQLEAPGPLRWGLLAVRPVAGAAVGVALRRLAAAVTGGG